MTERNFHCKAVGVAGNGLLTLEMFSPLYPRLASKTGRIQRLSNSTYCSFLKSIPDLLFVKFLPGPSNFFTVGAASTEFSSIEFPLWEWQWIVILFFWIPKIPSLFTKSRIAKSKTVFLVNPFAHLFKDRRRVKKELSRKAVERGSFKNGTVSKQNALGTDLSNRNTDNESKRNSWRYLYNANVPCLLQQEYDRNDFLVKKNGHEPKLAKTDGWKQCLRPSM